MTQILIRGGRVIDPSSGLDQVTDLAISAGQIVSIGPDASAALSSAQLSQATIIEAQSHWVIPGLVDLSARLREPGFEYKATLESEMQAAIAGGVTALSCPPDTDPVLDEPGLVQMLKHRARGLKQAHLFPLGALTVGLKGEILTEMAELSEAGCVGFSQANMAMVDTQILLRAMQYAHSFGFTVWLQPQDPHLSRGGVAHSGSTASRMGLTGIPVTAETVALHTILELVRSTQCAVHLCRLSSAAGIALVRAAKKEGLPVTADVAIHHTLLCDVDIGYFDSNYRVDPPFRSQRDRDAILSGLADGTIDAICSDHTPVDDDAKLLPFAEAQPGLTGLEMLLPLGLKLVEAGHLDAMRLIRCLSTAPAKILSASHGKPQAKPSAVPSHLGKLSSGMIADVVVVDPRKEWMPDAKSLRSQGKHTPFSQTEVQGRAVAVIVQGQSLL